MKKFFVLFIITFFVLFVPMISVKAVTDNQLKALVQIVCPDSQGNWFSGSGTIIDPKGIILTNRHVVTGADNKIISACFIGFTESMNQEPNFGSKGDPNLAEVKYFTTSDDMDAAILYLNNKSNTTYPSVDIWNFSSSNLKFGDKIEVVGFPGIGGSTITYTSGDFSGFGAKSDGTQNYIKTTTPLEHGNSGGSAYNSIGDFVGIPTMVIAGKLNSLSYILSINSLKKWLSGTLGTSYKDEIIQTSPTITKPEAGLQLPTSITPPTMKGYTIEYKIVNNDITRTSKIQYFWNTNNISHHSNIVKYYYYFGSDLTKDPVIDGESFAAINNIVSVPVTFDLDKSGEKYFILRIQDEVGNISPAIIAYVKTSDMRKAGQEYSLYSLALKKFKIRNKKIFNKYSGLFIKNNNTIWWVSPRDQVRYVAYDPSLGVAFMRETLETWFRSWLDGKTVSTGITVSNLKKKPKNVWGHFLTVWEDDHSGAATTGCSSCYIDPRDRKLIDFGSMIDWNGVSTPSGEEALSLIKKLAVNITDKEINYIQPLGSNNYVLKSIQYDKDNERIPSYGF